MKDVSTLSTKPSRASVYPKKRPSPHGVVKNHKSPLLPAYGPLRRSPRSAKSQQKQYEAQILALRRQGVLLEEEYREEIRQYMHDMEVRLLTPFASSLLIWLAASHDVFPPVYGSATRNQVAHASMPS
jgi:hypothetical protein